MNMISHESGWRVLPLGRIIIIVGIAIGSLAWSACSDVVQERPQASVESDDTESESGKVLHTVDEMPSIVGGMGSIVDKIKYPDVAKQEGIEGRVLVQFVVNENGDVTQPVVIKGVSDSLDEEALRVVRDIKFVPGKQDGQEVKVKLTLPITFKLQ